MTPAEVAQVISLAEWQVANIEAGRAQLSPDQRKKLRQRFRARAAGEMTEDEFQRRRAEMVRQCEAMR